MTKQTGSGSGTARWRLGLGPLAIALLAAACSSSPKPAAGPGSSSGGAKIETHSSKFGTILTDGSGRSVYLFESDTGATSTCYNACAGLWPPLTTTSAGTAIAPAQSALVGTTPRRDGGKQVTYAGHPLYYYGGDQNPGDVNGQALNSFGGGWDLLKPSGVKVESAAQ